jgi:SAM-dependent methyltransferase
MHALSSETIKGLIRWSLDTAPERGPHITRFFMYKALTNCLQQYDTKEKTGLAISLSRPFAQTILGLKLTKFTDANYPEHSILNLSFSDGHFDFCISDQVLEHVEGDPIVAFRESARVLRPGGIMCHTTCFINEVHKAPGDFWRFTPDALGLMARLSGCKPLIVGGWGNREAWGIIRHGFRFDGIPIDEKHPLHRVATHNEPDVPIVVWIVAERLDSPVQ